MISCRRTRALLVENVRGAVPEGALLQLDQHLVECAACQEERARMSTLASLRDWTPPGLGAAARARIVATLATRPPASASASASRAAHAAARAPRTRRRAWALGLAGAQAAAALVVVAARPLRTPSVARHAWSAPGTVRFLDAELGYAAGTRVALEPGARTIRLDEGALEVRDRGAPIRVVTHARIVLVSGQARFAGEQIRVYSGEVVVFDSAMHRLATVGAGESWPPATATPATAAPATATPATAAPATATPAPRTLPTPASPAATPPPSTKRHTANDVEAASDDLDRARAALAAGDAAAARRFAHRAWDAATGAQHRAEAELFLAESYLVDHQPDRAITVYRQIAVSFPRTPEGEAAAFAAAQMLYERGRIDEARAALRDYVARYPDGRFAREATDRLSALAE
jgi:TolA-binding protein